MRPVALIAMAAGLAAAQTTPGKLVSSAFGDRTKLYESEQDSRVKFTLENSMPSPIVHYAIETWITGPRGPVCACSIAADSSIESKGAIPKECTIPTDSETGKAVPHSSRIVGLRLANGWTWHPGATYRVHKN